MSNFVDHYAILGISPSDTGEDLYKGFCHAVRQWLMNDPNFDHENLKRLQDSYRILQNPGKRRAYHDERLLNLCKDHKKKKVDSKPNDIWMTQKEEYIQVRSHETMYKDSRSQQERVKYRYENQYYENLHQDEMSDLYVERNEEVSTYSIEKINEEYKPIETIQKDSQYYEPLDEMASLQYYDNVHQEYSNQCHGTFEETNKQYHECLQNHDQSNYFEHYQEPYPQYYGYHSGYQQQCYEYIQQEIHQQYFSYLQENQCYQYGHEIQPPHGI